MYDDFIIVSESFFASRSRPYCVGDQVSLCGGRNFPACARKFFALRKNVFFLPQGDLFFFGRSRFICTQKLCVKCGQKEEEVGDCSAWSVRALALERSSWDNAGVPKAGI